MQLPTLMSKGCLPGIPPLRPHLHLPKQVPHPWYASVLGAPGSYPWLPDNDGKPVSLLIPNPEAPHDPL